MFTTGRQNMWNIYQSYFIKYMASEDVEGSSDSDSSGAKKEGTFAIKMTVQQPA